MDDEIKQAFDAFAPSTRDTLLILSNLIQQAAEETKAFRETIEKLKWGQPSYLPKKSRMRSTVRIGTLKTTPDTVALFFDCQTRLVETFRRLYPDTFTFEGNRSMLVRSDGPIPEDKIRHCVSLALTYHLRK